MTTTTVPLNGDEFRDIFPFHLAFDRELRLVQVGRSWSRLVADVVPGARLADLFRITRPRIALDYDTIRSQSGGLFVMECISLQMSVRGQLRLASDGAHLLFLASPWITDLEDLKRFHLTLTDFPAHEPISDYLFLIQSQRTALEDASRMAMDLQEREGTLRSVLDTAAEGIITIDGRGTIRSFNTAAATIFGYQPEEVIRRNVSMLMPMPDRADHDQYLSRYLATGEARIIGHGRELTGVRKDGSSVSLALSVSEVTYGPERLFTGILRDLTEPRRAAEALLASDERLRQTLSAARAGVWEWNLSTHTSQWEPGSDVWSPETYRMFGLEPGSPVTRDTFYSVIHVDDRERVRTVLREAIERRQPFDLEFRVVWNDGSLHWLHSVGRVFYALDGRPQRMAGIATDVTESHTSVEALRASQALLQQTLSAAGAGAWEWNFVTEENFWSEQTFRMYGIAPGTLITRDVFYGLIHPDDRHSVREKILGAASGDGNLDDQFRVVWPDGTERWLRSVGRVARDAHGRPVRMSGISIDITEQHHRQNLLKDAEERLRQTLATVRAGLWQYDFASRKGYWSDENYELLGLEPGSVEPTPELFLSRIHPDDRARNAESMRLALEGRGPLEDEHRVIHADGSVRWMRGTGVVVRDAQGVPVRISGLSLDVTDSHRAEDAVRAAREQAVCRSDAQQRVTNILASASTLDEAAEPMLRSFCDLLGWAVGALWLEESGAQRLRCAALWHAPDADVERFVAATRVNTFAKGVGIPGRVWAKEWSVWAPNLSAEPVFPGLDLALAANLRSAFGLPVVRQGRVAGVVEFFSREAREPDRELLNMFGSLGSQFGEFLERIEAIHALRTSERQLRQVVDTALDGVISIDAVGRIVEWNPQSAGMFGWTREEVVGRPIDEVIIPPSLREAHRQGLIHYHATGEGPVLNSRIELDGLHRDGHTFPIELSIATVLPRGAAAMTPAGAESAAGVAMFSAFVRDISERRRTNEALSRAKDAAEAAAQARSEFVAMMSHEIRTPLNGVIGMLNLALKTDMTPQQFEQLSIARRSADLLLAVTNDVLDFSKIEAGRLDIEDTSFDLHQLVDDVIGTVKPQASEGVQVSAVRPPGLPTFVLGDPVRLRQILVNLVGNAVKFTSRGHVHLAVTMTPPAEDRGAHLCFTVEDTGIGIPAAQHQSIFEAFTQADSSTTRRFGGTGLGLPIAARLSRLMHGTLRLVRSTPEGSTFELELPLHLADVGPRPETVGFGARTVSGRVLVVDDNGVNRDIAAAMLRHVGCTVHLAANGLEAIAAVDRAAYDLVFMDCQMPDMDGYEATRALRARGFTPERLPIVAMTAGALIEDRERSLAAGMNAHISKPLLDEPLMEALLTWLPATPSGGQPAPVPASAPAAVPHVDLAKLRKTRELMEAVPGAWGQMVEAFIEQGTRAMQTFEAAGPGGDRPAITRAAHELKGSAGMIGASTLAQVASELEQAAKAGSMAECRRLVEAIRLELDAAAVVMRAEKLDERSNH